MTNQKCPNNNPEFNKLFDTIAGNHTPATRRRLYYLVCIPLRFGIFLFLTKYHSSKWVLGVIALVALFELVKKAPRMCVPQNQWWSVQFQVFIAFAMLFASLSALAGKTDSAIVPAIWLISIIGGLAQSFVNPIC